MAEANLQLCACMHRSASSEVCVVENGNGKMRILILIVGKMQSRMEPRGGSACQVLPWWRLVLHMFQQFLPHYVHPHHVHRFHCNSESFPFTASCFFRGFSEIHGWELLEMCMTKFDLFISFYLLLI